MDAYNKLSKQALLVSSSPDGEKQQPVVSKKEDSEKMPAVVDACVWVLSFSFTFGILSAYNIIFGPQTTCDQCLASKWCYVVAEAAADEYRSLEHWQLWCGVLQAAAAVMALLLLASRRLRAISFAFACAALAATIANHCMYVRTQCLLLAGYPGDLGVIANILVMLIVLGMDLLRFRRLVRGWDEEQRGKQ